MADWTCDPHYPDAPGSSRPPVDAGSAGWAPWIRNLYDEIRNLGDGFPEVSLEVRRVGTEFWFAIEGDNPGPWEVIGEEFVVDTPEYRDFTQYRRRYPSITWQLFQRLEVTVTFRWKDGTVYSRHFTFWEAGARFPPDRNWWVYRWVQTSGVRMEDGGVIGEWRDTRLPPDVNTAPVYPDDTPTRTPQPRLELRIGMQSRADWLGEYASWAPSSQEILLSAKLGRWVKLKPQAGTKPRGQAKGARKAGAAQQKARG